MKKLARSHFLSQRIKRKRVLLAQYLPPRLMASSSDHCWEKTENASIRYCLGVILTPIFEKPYCIWSLILQLLFYRKGLLSNCLDWDDGMAVLLGYGTPHVLENTLLLHKEVFVESYFNRTVKGQKVWISPFLKTYILVNFVENEINPPFDVNWQSRKDS